MKKLIFATLVVAMIGTSAFAADGSKVNLRVANSFNAMFRGAKNVSWTSNETFNKAVFQLNGETLEAFFTPEGESIGVSKKVDLKDLPAKALARIRKEYAAYQINEVILFEQEGNSKYYASLSNGAKTQLLEVSASGYVTTYNK